MHMPVNLVHKLLNVTNVHAHAYIHTHTHTHTADDASAHPYIACSFSRRSPHYELSKGRPKRVPSSATWTPT